MSEYTMTHTGKELDDAINKVKSGYVLPGETINITSNVSNRDITNGKWLNVNVPVPDGYVNIAELLTHCSRSASGRYSPTANTVMNDISITTSDANGAFRPKIFVIFHSSRIENSGTDTAKIAVTASVSVMGNDGNALHVHTAGIYYHSTYKACSNQSSSRYFNPVSGGVQGVGADYYLQSGKNYNWYAWG